MLIHWRDILNEWKKKKIGYNVHDKCIILTHLLIHDGMNKIIITIRSFSVRHNLLYNFIYPTFIPEINSWAAIVVKSTKMPFVNELFVQHYYHKFFFPYFLLPIIFLYHYFNSFISLYQYIYSNKNIIFPLCLYLNSPELIV